MSERQQVLQTIFKNQPDDLEANRAGRMSDSQRRHHRATITTTRNIGLGVVGVLGIIFMGMLLVLDAAAAVPIVLIALVAFIAFIVRFSQKALHAISTGKAAVVHDILGLETHASKSVSRGINDTRTSTSQHFLCAGERLFRIPKETYDALEEIGIGGKVGTVYYIDESHIVLGVELG